MKRILTLIMVCIAVCAVVSQAEARRRSSRYYWESYDWVSGYVKDNGTLVMPYSRTMPDGNLYNNWSTYGNVNPLTGKPGTKRVNELYRYQYPKYNW